MRSQIEPLTGVRGLAILLVVLSHASYHELNLIEGLDFTGVGKAGVFLFFVLGAFLLTFGLLAKCRSATDLIAVMPRYFTRRILRIYPLYLLGLLASLAVSLYYAPFYVDSIASLIKHLLLLEGRGIFWTIPVSFGYYLILPLVAAVLLVAQNRPGLIFISLILFVTLWQNLFPPDFKPFMPYFLSLFLMGSVAAYVFYYMEQRYPEIVASRLFRWLATTACVLALAVIAITTPSLWGYIIGRQVSTTYFYYDFIMFGIVSTALILGTVWSDSALCRLFTSRVMTHLGEIGFSLYVWHIFVANALELVPAIPTPIRFILYCVLAISIAHVSYVRVEKPFLRVRSFREIGYWLYQPKGYRPPAC